jgi:hypothetical protein
VVKDDIKKVIRLKILTLVLTLVLTWAAMNPAPGPVIRKRQEDEPPDEKRSEARQQVRAGLSAIGLSENFRLGEQEADEFDWPEYIDDSDDYWPDLIGDD